MAVALDGDDDTSTIYMVLGCDADKSKQRGRRMGAWMGWRRVRE
jgi:hypothetical protein